MFQKSTQCKSWIFKDITEIEQLHVSANDQYKIFHQQLHADDTTQYLSVADEQCLLMYYSQVVYDVCRRFKPPVPLSVIGMSLAYFKRFYLATSAMEYHPKDMAYLCVYLACKVDEYNVSIDQFMAQAVAKPSMAVQTFIIDNELVLLQKLNYHLTVHSPYRALEGFIIDIKTKRIADDVEQCRQSIERFLNNSLLTNVMLIYTPSQVALAAIYYGFKRENTVKYLTVTVQESAMPAVIQKLECIKEAVLNFKFPSKTAIAAIEEKMGTCQDQENDPFSECYHEREAMRKEAKDTNKKFQDLENMKTEEERLLAAMD